MTKSSKMWTNKKFCSCGPAWVIFLLFRQKLFTRISWHCSLPHMVTTLSSIISVLFQRKGIFKLYFLAKFNLFSIFSSMTHSVDKMWHSSNNWLKSRDRLLGIQTQSSNSKKRTKCIVLHILVSTRYDQSWCQQFWSSWVWHFRIA